MDKLKFLSIVSEECSREELLKVMKLRDTRTPYFFDDTYLLTRDSLDWGTDLRDCFDAGGRN